MIAFVTRFPAAAFGDADRRRPDEDAMFRLAPVGKRCGPRKHTGNTRQDCRTHKPMPCGSLMPHCDTRLLVPGPGSDAKPETPTLHE